MTGRWRTVRGVTSAPAYVAAGLIWLAAVLYGVIGNFIVRETAAGRLAQQIDRLPSFLAKPVFILCWCLFFLGWTVPLSFGIKRLFRCRRHDLPH
jgi:hypothetical protein